MAQTTCGSSQHDRSAPIGDSGIETLDILRFENEARICPRWTSQAEADRLLSRIALRRPQSLNRVAALGERERERLS